MIARIEERKKRRTQLGDRKSAHAQARMKSIANLAAEDVKGKKRKKGEGEFRRYLKAARPAHEQKRMTVSARMIPTGQSTARSAVMTIRTRKMTTKHSSKRLRRSCSNSIRRLLRRIRKKDESMPNISS